MSFNLKSVKKSKSTINYVIDILTRLYHEIKRLNLKDPLNNTSSDWFKKVILLHFITQLFLGFKLLNSLLGQQNKDWYDVYSINNDPFDIIIRLRSKKFFLQVPLGDF